MYKNVLEKLKPLMKRGGVSALMVAPSTDMVFLLGDSPYLCERFQALVIKDDGTYFYICNLLSVEEAEDLLDGNGKVYGWFDGEDFTQIVKTAFEENGLIGKKIAVNGAVRAFNTCKIIENVDVSFENGKHYLEETRIIKTAEELENLRKSSNVVDRVFEELIKFIKPGMTEGDISAQISILATEFGGANCSGGIVARGENAALPHYFGKTGIIKERDSIEMDFGCTVNGMWSDITRTVFIGEPTDREKEIYNLVLKSNLAGIKAAVNGAFAPDVDKAARDVIAKSGYGKYFTHRLGHGIGYAGHEEPYITGVNNVMLLPGMAFTVEPGIYIKGEVGMRIEDVVIINEKGETEVLNKCTKEMVIIK